MSSAPGTTRSESALRHHYNVECELADQLRQASPPERLHLYRQVYNELFRRVPDHSQLTRKRGGADQREATDRQLRVLRRFLKPETIYLEIGAGDCHLTCAVASQVRAAFAVDVSDSIASGTERPSNFSLIITEGIQFDVSSDSVDLAYSHQLIEHLHPDDARDHLREVLRVLRPGGRYVCTTPHRFSGPHDISKYFDDEARGFHLKEYCFGELSRLFLDIGFAKTGAWCGIRGWYGKVPNAVVVAAESSLRVAPPPLRKRLARLPIARSLFDSLTIIGTKARANR